jgi:outer membrane immunogenic protein
MKKLLAGIALAALVAGRAMAADMAVKAPPPAPPPVPIFNWSGFYIGGHIGWGGETLISAIPS